MKQVFKKFHATLILVVFLVAALAQFPIVRSADLPEMEMVKTFLKDVALLDVEKYEIELVNVFDENWLGASWLYRLTSAESTIEMSCNIRNNTLVTLWLNPIGGSLVFVQPATDALDAAKSFMDSYRAFSQKAHLQPLQDMLDQVTEIETVTHTLDNITFTVEPSPVAEEYVSFNWMNGVNGIYNGYNGFSVYFRDGNFKRFSDTWNRYPIGSADAMSQEEAYSIAKAAVEAFSYGFAGQTISGLVVSDKYASPVAELTMQPRGEALYPSWYFLVPLNQSYPPGIASIQVLLWADTGEISAIALAGGMGGPSPLPGSSPGTSTPAPSESPPPDSSATLPTGVILYASAFAAAIGTVAVTTLLIKRRKK
jgi:hypothetical protein